MFPCKPALVAQGSRWIKQKSSNELANTKGMVVFCQTKTRQQYDTQRVQSNGPSEQTSDFKAEFLGYIFRLPTDKLKVGVIHGGAYQSFFRFFYFPVVHPGTE